MDTIKQEYLAERMRVQKEAQREVAEQNKCWADINVLINRIVKHPTREEERERLINGLVHFGIVNWLVSNGCSDRQITEVIDQAVARGKVRRLEENTEQLENFDRVCAALYALELEELELATMDALLLIRLSL